MIATTIRHGIAAGLIVGSLLFGITVGFHDAIPDPMVGMAIGYASMLLAFALIFVAVKRHRDRVGGGIIGFAPALAMGLGITLIATLFYVAAWEAALAATGLDLGAEYGAMMIAEAQRTGDAAAVAQARAEAARFAADYARPLWRVGVTATEILPVGTVVALLVALILHRPRLWHRRRA